MQSRTKRWAVIKYLDLRKEKIFSLQKASQMKFEHTASYIVFDGKITWDKEQLPPKYWPWFDVLSINNLTEKLYAVRSKLISLTPEEAWRIPTELSLRNEDKQIDVIVKKINIDNVAKDVMPILEDKKISRISQGYNKLIKL